MENTFYLIEKGPPGGTYWFKGRRDLFSFHDTGWPVVFTNDANQPIRFLTHDDAEAVRRMLPQEWQEILTVTEHVWMKPEVANNSPELDDAADFQTAQRDPYLIKMDPDAVAELVGCVLHELQVVGASNRIGLCVAKSITEWFVTSFEDHTAGMPEHENYRY